MQHSLGNCTSQPNDNRDEYRPAPQEYLGLPQGNPVNSTNPSQRDTNVSLPYRDYRYDQDRARHQQTRFDKRYNKQH